MKRQWVLEYVNVHEFIGRWDRFWGLTADLEAAALFGSRAEADLARQALLQEARDRIADRTWHAPQFWWDIAGGLVLVREVEIRTTLRPQEDEA